MTLKSCDIVIDIEAAAHARVQWFQQGRWRLLRIFSDYGQANAKHVDAMLVFHCGTELESDYPAESVGICVVTVSSDLSSIPNPDREQRSRKRSKLVDMQL